MSFNAITALSSGRGSAAYNLVSGRDPENGRPDHARITRSVEGRDELPYRVELWDEARQGVEQVLAVTAHGSIGFAAYYAALREYPGRYITLRRKDRTVARSVEPEH